MTRGSAPVKLSHAAVEERTRRPASSAERTAMNNIHQPTRAAVLHRADVSLYLAAVVSLAGMMAALMA